MNNFQMISLNENQYANNPQTLDQVSNEVDED